MPTTTRYSPFFALLLSLLAVGAPAQTPLPRTRVPIHTAPADPVGGAYGTWAVGGDYKVSFQSGMAFVPYLGASYPRVQQLGWRTLSVRSGDETLVDDRTPSRHRHDAFRYEYAFGSMVEAYDVRDEGLEQTFVFAQRPAGAGDLVVTGEFVTDLLGQPRDDGAIDFVDAEGATLIRYGAATVVDAAGRSLPLATSLAARTATLRVPASWLAEAQFPVTIDPLVTPVTIDSSNGGLADTDIVRDDGTNTLLLCLNRYSAWVESDAFAWTFGDGWTGAPTAVFADVTTSWETKGTRCSYCGPRNTWVIGMVRGFTLGSAVRVWAQPTSTATLVTTVLAAPGGTATDWQVDVGGIAKTDEGNFPLVGDHCLVVYQHDTTSTVWTNTADSDVYGLLVDCSTSPATLGTPFAIGLATSGYDQERPTVNKIGEGGALPSWVVAWQIYSNNVANDDWDLMAARVFANGTTTTTTAGQRWTSLAPNDMHSFGAVVAGQNGRFCIAYHRLGEGSAPLTKINALHRIAAYSVVVERFDWPTGGTIVRQAPVTVSASPGTNTFEYRRVWDIAHDSDTDGFWAVMWERFQFSTVNEYDSVRITRIDSDAQSCELVALPVSYFTPVGGFHLGGSLDYDDDGNQFAFTYSYFSSTAPNQFTLGGEMTYPVQAAPALQGIGCATTTLAWEATDSDGTVIAANDQVIGHPFTRFRASGAPAGSIHFPLVSLATTDVLFGHPLVALGCHQLVDTQNGYLGMLPIAIGTGATWSMPIPGFLPSFTLYCQDWVLDPATSLFRATRRLEVPLAK